MGASVAAGAIAVSEKIAVVVAAVTARKNVELGCKRKPSANERL